MLYVQKPEVLGNKVEMEISRLLRENKTMLRFGITFEYADARIRTNERLKQNFDDCEWDWLCSLVGRFYFFLFVFKKRCFWSVKEFILTAAFF